jgi:polyribonucleotide 5'-hydroxyl-kinase
MGREKIPPRQELRFETAKRLPDGADSCLRVLRGSAELCGLELLVGHEYPLLCGQSYGVFSWFGCELELHSAFCSGVYVSEETPMASVIKVHYNLEAMRSKASGFAAAAAARRGPPGAAQRAAPRVAVVGAGNAGKSTLVRTLAAYAARCGRRPVLVDLDVCKNMVGVPGSIGATVVERAEDLFGEGGELGVSCGRRPLCYWVGTDRVADATKRLKECATLLSADVDALLSVEAEAAAGGLVVDTFAWSAAASVHTALVACLQALRVNVVVVIGHDRLFSEMKKALDPQVIVVKIARSGGVVEADAAAAKRQHSERLKAYFYGARSQLTPNRLTLKLGEEVKIFLPNASAPVDDSLRPIGKAASAEEDAVVPQLTVVDPQLEGLVLAVVACAAADCKDVLNVPVLGFVHIESVSVQDGTITFGVPCPGPLASATLLHSKVKYYEVA